MQLDHVKDVAGDIIECGSAHCGTSIVMARFAKSQDMRKVVYACDSFEGFDQAELAREHAEGLTAVGSGAFKSTSYGYVLRKIAALGMEADVIPVRGYFQDTLPGLPGPFCLALIDCDLRDSMLFAAGNIWPKLPTGGRLLFDDYTNRDSKGAKAGVDVFVKNHAREIADHGLLGRLYYAVKA
jgi:O-methyltransferase